MAAANDSNTSGSPLETKPDDAILATPNGHGVHPAATHPTAQSVGDSDAGDKGKRKRQPRNSACQSCAALKMKCIATSTPGVCERCNRMNRECLPAVPKPRKRRATDGFESKGIPLADLLDHTSPPPDPYRPSPRAFVNEVTNGDVSKNPLLSQPDLTDYGSKSFMRLFAQGLAIDDHSADQLLRGVDFTFVRRSSNAFRHMAMLFPFVSIPFVDPASMVARRPVTTVAICTVASASQPDIQARLSKAFRHVLATRCIVEGERSLDLLVGLLVYLAWHHHYYDKQQIYQQLCLMAGMAVELGLQRTPSLAEQARGVPDQETQRAFLGVYYLTTSLSLMAFNKPAPLSWTSSLDHFASSIYSSSSREINLQPLVDLAHLLEEHAALLATSPPGSSAVAYTDLATKSTLSRLKALQRTHASAASGLAYNAATVHIQARAMAPTFSLASPANLMQTAVALKDYTDDLLARPPLTLHHVALVDWTNLFETLVLTARLGAPYFLSSVSQNNGSLGWDPSALSSILQPDAALEAVSAHMSSAPVDSRQGPRNEQLVAWLRGVSDNVRRRLLYERNGEIPPDTHWDGVSGLERGRRESAAAMPMHEEGRFRAVNADTVTDGQAHSVGAPPSLRSPRSVNDLGFDLFGGVGLLHETFCAAFGNAGVR